MALANSQYATAAQYRAAIDQDDTGEDSEIDDFLAAVSRYIDMKTGRYFGTLSAVDVLIIDGNGETRLWLPRDIGNNTGLIVTVDIDGDYSFADETALVLDTDYWLGPEDWDPGDGSNFFAAEAKPIEWFEIHPNSTRLSAWPERRRSVQVTALWGWGAVPEPIERGTIAITKQLRDVTRQPFTLTLDALEQRVSLAPGASALINDLVKKYEKRILAF